MGVVELPPFVAVRLCVIVGEWDVCRRVVKSSSSKRELKRGYEIRGDNPRDAVIDLAPG